MNLSARTKQTSAGCIIIIMPFLLFYWMIPFIFDVTIGNDYLAFSIKQQMELLFSLKTGSFPLYVPGFASGQSSSALTLGQMFHPLSHIASIMPGYWNGKAIEWNNFFKLLSLGLAQLALFFFLQKIRLNVLFSFLLSFITVYNLRTVDLFRHGTPLEAYTGYLILCAVIGWYFIDPKKWIGPLCVIAATYLLVCSGHPEEMYFGMLGVGLFMLIAPFYLSTMVPDKYVDYNIAYRFWLRTGLCVCLGILLSSVYIIPFYFDFIKANIDRVGKDYAWALSDLDTFTGTLNNFLLPLRSEPNSAFGGSSLTLMAVVLPALRFFKIKIPRSIWAIWGLSLFIFLFMQGSRTPVHRLVWENFPFASSIRGPGRISMIMPFFVMLLLAWAVKIEPSSPRFVRSSLALNQSVILACFALLLIVIYYLIYVGGYHVFSLPIFKELFRYYSDGNILNIPSFWVVLIVTILGVASLISFAVYVIRDSGRGIGLLLIIMTLLQLGIVLKFSSSFWTDKKYDSVSFEKMRQCKRTSLDYRYYPGGGLHSSIVMEQLKRSVVEPFLGKIYTSVVPVTNKEEGYERMAQERLPHQVFIEGYNPERAKTITDGAKNMKEGLVKLTYSSFNRLQFRVISETPALFGLSYPYTGHWGAWVNGKRVHVYRSNGAAHAVEIPNGESLVEFRYWSDAYLGGMGLSCITFAIIGLFISFNALKSLPRILGVVIVLFVSSGGFLFWYNSLYRGDNLDTKYTWAYTPPLKIPNIAYGKKIRLDTSDTNLHWAALELELYRGRFVDGDSTQCSGFITRRYISPIRLILDLYKNRDIKTVVLHEGCQNKALNKGPLNMLDAFSTDSENPNQTPPVNLRPLSISLSTDGKSWRTVALVLSTVNSQAPTRIVFDEPYTARYIKIEPAGISKLMFDEVEVYGVSFPITQTVGERDVKY